MDLELLVGRLLRVGALVAVLPVLTSIAAGNDSGANGEVPKVSDAAFCADTYETYGLGELSALEGHVCACPSTAIKNAFELELCLNFYGLIKAQGSSSLFQGMPAGYKSEDHLRGAFVKFKNPIKKPKLPKPKPATISPDRPGKI